MLISSSSCAETYIPMPEVGDVDFLLVPGELLQAVGVEWEVGHCVVVRVSTEWLRKEKFTVSPIFQSATIQILCTILSADGWKDY